jgi:hypothetical protein
LNNYVVLAASTTIASFTSSPTISALGQTVTFTATVSANAPSTALVNGGNVTFRDITGAPVTLGTSPVSGSGVATLNVSSLSLGLHTIEAVYAGSSPNFNASPAVTLTQDVRKAATINVSPIAGAVFGQPLTYAITVTGTPGTPTGTVTILEGLATLGSNTLSSGATSINIGPLTAGTHNLVFEYSGDTVPAFGFAPTSRTIVQTVAAAGTTTTLAPLPARFFGEPVTLTATITTNAPSLAAAPTAGTVSFFDGATLLQAMPLSGSNIAIYQTSTLSVGTHTITAVYTGGLPSYANSFTTGTQTINGVATTTTLLPLSPTTYGNAVTFNVTVAPTTGAAVPTGTVAFRAGTTVLGTRTLANGAASFTTTPTQLAAGNHSITVVYTPSTTSFGGSTSPAQNQAVAAASTVTTVTSSAASGSVFGNAVTFTAIVTVTSGGSPGVPTGFALFYDGAVPLSGVVALTNGRATFTTSTLAAGLHNIRAYYAPNPANFVSTFGALTQNVAAASTATVLTSLPPFWAINQAVTFSATVGATSGGSPGTPTGTVTFVIDGVSQTPVALSGGRATFTHTFTTLGNHSVSAIYTPNTANFNGSAAGTQQQNVRRPSSLVISSQSFPAYVNIGANVTALSGGGVPTGTVSFYELLNGVAILLGTAPLNSNGATAILADLATGSHTIRAVYSGDAIFSPTVSTAVVQGKTNGRVV